MLRGSERTVCCQSRPILCETHHPSHLTAALYPSGQRDLLVYIRDSKFSTRVCSKHILNLQLDDLLFYNFAKVHKFLILSG